MICAEPRPNGPPSRCQIRCRDRNWEWFPSPVVYGVWGSVVSSPVESGQSPGQPGLSPVNNGFGTFLAWKNTYDGKWQLATNCLEYEITPNNDSEHTGSKKKPERWRSWRERESGPITIEAESILKCRRLICVLNYAYCAHILEKINCTITCYSVGLIVLLSLFVCHKFLVLTMEN